MTSASGSTVKPESSFARNVAANWVGQLVFTVAGFVMPRLIGDQIGAEALGVWDFGWSIVSYAMFLSLDIGGAVNRYVARYRALADWESMNAAVSSAVAILTISFAAGLVMALAFTILVPVLIPSLGARILPDARVMVFVLGCNAAIQLPLSVLNGVMSGCERFDLKNAIRIVVRVSELVAMAICLTLGGGLVALACVVLFGTVVREGLNYAVVRHICPQLRVAARLASWPVAREVLSFGGKSALQSVSRSGLYQTNGIVVAFFLGPAALAIYARQRNLVVNAARFLTQYAHVLIPKSSILYANGNDEGLRELLVRSTRCGFYISLPIVVLLVIMGGPLVRVWMGSGYEAPLVLALLALGHLIPFALQPAFCILVGMHRHAGPAVWEAVGSVVSVGLGLLFVGVFGWGMLGAALAIVLPLNVSAGLMVLIVACRALELDAGRQVAGVVGGAFGAVLPFALCLGAARWFWEDSPTRALAFGVISGGVVLTAVYWRWVLPKSIKARVRRLLRLPGPAAEHHSPLGERNPIQ